MIQEMTINEGGEKEEVVRLNEIVIKDLWHLAMWMQDLHNAVKAEDESAILNLARRIHADSASESMLETWHLAHDMLNELKASVPVQVTCRCGFDGIMPPWTDMCPSCLDTCHVQYKED